MTNMSRVSTLVTLVGGLLWISTARAADPVTKCQEAKLKARGKLELCLQKNSAKVLGGKDDESAKCQTAFSDALGKADATAMKKNAACRFIDNGDGTVSDLNTGLQWEQKNNSDGIANDNDPHDADNTYTWCSGAFPSCTNSANPPDGTTYTDFLAKLNNGFSTDGGPMTTISGCFAGHCDWRLPSIVELQDIVDSTASGCGAGSPCIDPTFGPTTALIHWSASTAAATPTLPALAWAVTFYFGSSSDLGYDVKTTAYYVRAVRGGL